MRQMIRTISAAEQWTQGCSAPSNKGDHLRLSNATCVPQIQGGVDLSRDQLPVMHTNNIDAENVISNSEGR